MFGTWVINQLPPGVSVLGAYLWLSDNLEAGVDEDVDFLLVVTVVLQVSTPWNIGFTMLIEEPDLGGDAFRIRSSDVLQLMEGCSYFTDVGSDICIRSSSVVQYAVEIDEAVHLLQPFALDSDVCAIGCLGQ
ncbi:hypothetical protein DPMN_133737 [Dreissena polymorpha]|uniref:Uncharacterized protein n=1 Tax=Dreissena polymorpha TaxID=45954 RepID=A0A9D4FU64_DREPO|nr:hypothetical protein DPMN_133737 [Dreissena polymorpha]